jgi:hypothetical protein
MDWDQIEDRARQPQKHPEFRDLAELAAAAANSYRLPRWADQDYYVELWVEKDALASVLKPLADEHHVVLMVNRGYSSASAMKEASDRFLDRGQGKECVLLYLGDLDPSGEDMVRDIDDRLWMFCANVDVRKVALNIEQVDEHSPPPNPAKLTDPRAAGFIAQFGGNSWEVDALHPGVLGAVIRAEFDEIIDWTKMDAVKAQEVSDLARLKEAVKEIMKSDG